MEPELQRPTSMERHTMCVKCRNKGFRPTYLPAKLGGPHLPERLVWKCKTCKYVLCTTLPFAEE